MKHISSLVPSVLNNTKIYLCCGGSCFIHHHLPWRWRQQVPPKCWYLSVKLHKKLLLLLQHLRNCLTSCSRNQSPHTFENPRVFFFNICCSVHHQSILLNNQHDAALSSHIYYSLWD